MARATPASKPEVPVVDDEEQQRQGGADERGLHAGFDRRLTERGADRALLDDVDRYRERTGSDQQGEVLGLCLGEVAGDAGRAARDARAAGDADADLRAGDDVAVERDGDPASGVAR